MTPPPTMPFSELLGIRVTTSTPDLVEAKALLDQLGSE